MRAGLDLSVQVSPPGRKTPLLSRVGLKKNVLVVSSLFLKGGEGDVSGAWRRSPTEVWEVGSFLLSPCSLSQSCSTGRKKSIHSCVKIKSLSIVLVFFVQHGGQKISDLRCIF